jgi:hypothetical protein
MTELGTITAGVARVLGVIWPIWFLLAWLIGVVLTPYVARQKRHDAASWCAVAIFASPVIALLALAALPMRQDDTTLPLPEEDDERGRSRRRETYRPFS